MSTIEGRDPTAAREFMSGRTLEAGPRGSYHKTASVYARQIDTDVKIETPEGVMEAHAGDYILSDDPPTHLWPVRREVFESTYVAVGDDDRLAYYEGRFMAHVGGDLMHHGNPLGYPDAERSLPTLGMKFALYDRAQFGAFFDRAGLERAGIVLNRNLSIPVRFWRLVEGGVVPTPTEVPEEE